MSDTDQITKAWSHNETLTIDFVSIQKTWSRHIITLQWSKIWPYIRFCTFLPNRVSLEWGTCNNWIRGQSELYGSDYKGMISQENTYNWFCKNRKKNWVQFCKTRWVYLQQCVNNEITTFDTITTSGGILGNQSWRFKVRPKIIRKKIFRIISEPGCRMSGLIEKVNSRSKHCVLVEFGWSYNWSMTIRPISSGCAADSTVFSVLWLTIESFRNKRWLETTSDKTAPSASWNVGTQTWLFQHSNACLTALPNSRIPKLVLIAMPSSIGFQRQGRDEFVRFMGPRRDPAYFCHMQSSYQKEVMSTTSLLIWKVAYCGGFVVAPFSVVNLHCSKNLWVFNHFKRNWYQ